MTPASITGLPLALRARGLRRWLAAFFVLVACPCASEVLAASVSAIFDAGGDSPQSCCADRDSGEHHAEAPARGCACCHVMPRHDLAIAVAEAPAASLTATAAPDLVFGDVRDGHVEPVFRPPAQA